MPSSKENLQCKVGEGPKCIEAIPIADTKPEGSTRKLSHSRSESLHLEYIAWEGDQFKCENAGRPPPKATHPWTWNSGRQKRDTRGESSRLQLRIQLGMRAKAED